MTIRALVFLAMFSIVPSASADVVGPFDPTAAEICGGSAHSPRCSPDLVGGACCSVFALGLALVGLRGFFRGKSEGSREGR